MTKPMACVSSITNIFVAYNTPSGRKSFRSQIDSQSERNGTPRVYSTNNNKDRSSVMTLMGDSSDYNSPGGMPNM
jgi:hypothetical protein